MKSRKGFTIVELLVVIIIIGILAGIGVPLVIKYLNKGKESYYKSLGNELVVMTKSYFVDNKKELPRGSTFFKVVTLETLKNGNYVTNEILDTNNNSCEQSYVTVEKEDDNYIYSACLICNGKLKYGNDCPFDGKSDNGNPSCEVSYKNYTRGTWTNKDIEVNITGIDNSGIAYFKIGGLKLTAKSNVGTTKISERKDYVVKVYDKAGNAGTCNISKDDVLIDKTKPTCLIKELEELNTATAKTLQLTGTDEESGIGNLKINNELLTNGQKIVKDNGTYTGRVTDNAGNYKECSIAVTGLDSAPPVCVWASGPSVGLIRNGETANYVLNCTDENNFSDNDIATSDFAVGGTSGAITVTNVAKSAITNGYSYTVTVVGTSTSGTANLSLKAGSVKDKANNNNVTSPLSSSVSIDNTNPVCAWVSGQSAVLIKNGRTASYVLNCTDANGFSDNNIAISDFTVGGTSGAITVTDVAKGTITNGYSYTVTVTGTGTSGTSNLSLKAGSVIDAVNNNNAASSASPNINVDNILPTCSITKYNAGTSNVTLVVTGSDEHLNNSPYSWTSSTSGYSTNNAKSVTSAGTYTAYVIDQVGNIGSCNSSVTSVTQYRYQTRGATANYWYTWGFCGDGYGSGDYGVTYYQDGGDTKTFWRPVPSSYTSYSSGLTSCYCASRPVCQDCLYYAGTCCQNDPSYCTCSSYQVTVTMGYYTCNPPSGRYTKTSGSNGNGSTGGGTSTCTYKVYNLYNSAFSCNINTSCSSDECFSYGSQYYCPFKYTTTTTSSTWHIATKATRYDKYYYTADAFTGYRCYRYDGWSGWSDWSTYYPGASSSSMNVESMTALE